MNFCNLIKGFVYHGHQLNFTYCEQDGGKKELFIYADDEKGKAYLNENRVKVECFIKDRFLNPAGV